MHHYYRDNTVEVVYPINSSVLFGQYLENEDDSRGFDENDHPNGFVNDWDSHRDFSEGPYNNPGWGMSHPRGENFGRYESQRHRTTFTPEHYQRGSNNRHIQTVSSRFEEPQPSQRCEQMSYRQRSHYNNQRKETEFHGKREKFSFPKEAWCPRKVNAFQAKRTCATRRSPPRELRQITNVSKTIGPHKKLIKSRFFSENEATSVKIESSSVKIVSSVKNEASSVKQAASLVKKEASSVKNGASSVMNKASSVKTGPSVGKEESSVKNEASFVKNAAASVKIAPPVGKEASSVKNDASFVKTAAASVKIAPPVGKEASSVENEASFVKTAAASVKIAPPVGKEASSVKNKASIVKTAAASVKIAPPVRKEASSVKNIASSVKNAAYSVKTASSVRKEASSVKKGASSVKTAASSVEKETSSVKKEATSVKKGASSVKNEVSSVKTAASSDGKEASSVKKEASSVKKEATSVKKGASSVKNEDSSVKTAASSNGKEVLFHKNEKVDEVLGNNSEKPEELWSDLSDVSMDLGTDEDDFSESANQKQNGIPDAKNDDKPQDESIIKIKTSVRENNNASSDENLQNSISRNPEEKCCMSNDNEPEEKSSSNAPQDSETSKKEETIPAQLNLASKDPRLFKKSLVTENHDDCKQTKNKNNTTEALVDPRTKSTEITISKNLPLELKLPQFWTEFKKRKMRPKIVKKQNEFLVPKKLKTRVKRIHNKPSVCARNLREIKKYVKSSNPTNFCCHVSIQKNECNIAPAPEISGSSDFISMIKTINTTKSYLPESARKNKDETSDAKISENKNSNTKNKQHIESKKIHVEGEKRKHANDTKSKPLKTEIPKSSKKNILPHSTTSNSKSNASKIENLFDTPHIEKKIGVKRECLDPPSNNIKTKKIRLENTSANKKVKNVIWEQQKSSTNKNKPSEGGLNTPINKKIKNGIVGNYRNILKSAADVVKPQVDSACNTSFILGILQKADNASKFQTSSEKKKKYDEGMSTKPNTNDGKLKNEKNKPRNTLEMEKPKMNDSSSAPASNPSIIPEISQVGRSLPMIVDDSVFSEASEPSVSEECATKVSEKVSISQEINTTNDMEYSLHIPESYKDNSDDLMKALDESINSITASISASKLKSDSKQIESSKSKQNAAVCSSSAVTENPGSHKETHENSKSPTQLSPPNENVIATKSTEDNCCLSGNITGDKLIEFLGEDEDEMLLIVKVIENPEIKEEVDEGLVNSSICEDQPEVKIEETNELSANIPEALPGDVEAEQGGSADENTPSGPSITVRSDIKVVSPEESIGSSAEVETEQQSNSTSESATDVTTNSNDVSADGQRPEGGLIEDGSQLFRGLLVSIPTSQTNTVIGMTMSGCSSDSSSANEHSSKQTEILAAKESNPSGSIEKSLDTSSSFSINEATGYVSTPVKEQTSNPVDTTRINMNSDNVPHAYNNCTDNLMPMRRSIPQMRNLRKSNTYNLNSTFNSVFKIVREYNEMTLRVDYISNGLTSINNHYVFEMDINNAKFLKTRLRMVFGDLMLSHLSTLPRTIRLNDMFIMRLLDCCARNIPAERKHMMIEKIWDLINVHSEKYEKYEYLKDWKRYIENELKMQCYLGVNMSSAQYWLLKDQICSYLNLLRPKNGRQTQTNPNRNMGARDSSRNLFASRNVGMFPTQQVPSAMILTTQTCYVSTGNAVNLRPNLQQPVSSHLKSPEANVAYPRYNAFQACQGQNAGFNAFHNQQRPNAQFSNENLRPNNAAFDHMNKRVPNAASEQMKSKAAVGNARNTHLDASKKHPNLMESILQPSSMNTQELNNCCRMETCSNMNATTRRLHCDAEKDLTLRALLSTSNTQTEGINRRDVWFNPPNVTVAACNLKSSVGQKHGLDPTFQPKSKKVCLARDVNNSTDCSRKTSPANVHVSPGVQTPASAIRNDKGSNSTSGGFKLSPPSTLGSPERAGSPYSTSFESFFGAASNAPSSAPFNDAVLSCSASSHAAAQACNTAPTSPCYVATSHLASPVTISEVPYPTPPISNSASSYAPSPTPNAQGDTAEGQTEEKPELKPSLCTIGCDFSKDPKTEPEEIIDLTWLDEDMVKEELFDSGDEATEQSLLILDNRKCVCEKVAEYLCSCNTVMYCSEECQLKDWINHQRVCSSVVIAPGVPDGNANTFI